nr:reverse transcriptase domain-containing protein [Tanacetum cinerariifolium]
MNDMIQQVQNSCQFHGLSGDDANKHLDKFLHVTQSIKVNGVTDDALHLYLFPHFLTHHAIAWFDHLPRNSINTFEQMDKNFLGIYFPPSMVTKLRNEITNFRQRYDESLFEALERYKLSIDRSQRSESSSSITSSSDTKIAALKAEMVETNKNLMRVLQVNQQVKAVTPNYETCGCPHSFSDFPAIVGQTQNVYDVGAYQGNNQGRNQFFQGANQGQNPPQAYQAPVYQASVYQVSVHQPQIPQPQVVTTNEFTNFMKANDVILKNMQTNMTSLTNLNLELKNMFDQFMKMNTASSSGSKTLPGNTITNPKEELKGITTRSGTAYQGPTIPTTSSSPVVEHDTEATKDMPVIASIIEPVVSPVSAPKPNQRLSIPYPSRFQDQKLREKANDQREKFFQIFKDLNFNIRFADALILMPKFSPSIKTLLTNKDKLCKLVRTPLNEHCSAVLLKKLPEKLGDPGKFLIPCDFPRMPECLALADLDASINLMPLFVWNKISLPELTPTLMTLELADRSISRPIGVAADVYVKVGKFHFPANFVVVDFNDDPRVPLILERSFLKTRRALIDVFEGELTLQVLGFSDVIASGNPTTYSDPNVSITSPTLTPFRNSDFLLEEVDAFLALEDDPTSLKIYQSYVDTEGDILLFEELKICEAKTDKSLIDEPPEVELKDLPPHLEFAFMEGDDKLPVIIAKDLSVKEKTALITVLKSHKRAIA